MTPTTTNPARPVPLHLNGGKVTEGFRAAVLDAAGRRGKSVNEVVLEAAGDALRAAGYDFPAVFPTDGLPVAAVPIAPKPGATLGQFNEFLAANAPEKPCAECGETRWGVLSAEGSVFSDGTRIFKGFLKNYTHGNGRELYPMCCANCGFTKFFAAEVVEKWGEA